MTGNPGWQIWSNYFPADMIEVGPVARYQEHKTATAMAAALALVFAAILAGCASNGTPASLEARLAERGYVLGAPVDRVKRYKLDGWNYLDRTHVIIHTGPSRHQLVTVRNTCHNLSSVEVLAFTTTTGDLTRFDKLIIRGAGNIREECVIEAIHELEKLPAKSDRGGVQPMASALT